MFIPYYNTPDNYSKYNQDIKVANGYCLNCNKPLTYKAIYCTNCTHKLFDKGLEDSRVTIGMAGRNAINYQQSLHRSIFGCNAHIDYRGLKENRIYTRVSKEAMHIATTKLRRTLLSKSYVYLGKRRQVNKYSRELYEQILDVRNLDKRIIYNILLFYISYHIENNHEFKSFVHFQVSMLHRILIDIEWIYKRINNTLPPRFSGRGRHIAKYWYWLFNEIDSTIKPLMNEIISDIYK